MSFGKFVIGLCIVFCSIYGGVFLACTPAQRAIVRTIIDVANVVCGDGDDVDACLLKMQGARAAAAKAQAKHDVSTAPAPVVVDAGADR